MLAFEPKPMLGSFRLGSKFEGQPLIELSKGMPLWVAFAGLVASQHFYGHNFRSVLFWFLIIYFLAFICALLNLFAAKKKSFKHPTGHKFQSLMTRRMRRRRRRMLFRSRPGRIFAGFRKDKEEFKSGGILISDDPCITNFMNLSFPVKKEEKCIFKSRRTNGHR